MPKRILQDIGIKVRLHLAAIPDSCIILLAFFLFLTITLFLSKVLFNFYPVEADSMAQYAGAKIFLEGGWTKPSHPLREFFDTYFFFNDGKYYTFYPPGHMLLLYFGHLIHFPAIINPMLGSLTLIATYFLTKELGGNAAAKLSLLLFLFSPFIIYMSSEYDNRATALLCVTLFTLFYIRGIKSLKPRYAAIAGFSLGYLLITRPQTAIFFILPFLAYSIYLIRYDFHSYFKLFLVLLISVMPFISFFLYYNFQTTGNIFLTGYQKYFDNSVLPGAIFFQENAWQIWSSHFIFLKQYIQLFSYELLGWPLSALLIIFFMFVFNEQQKYYFLLAAVIISIFLGLSLTRYAYIIFGPRYLYEISSITIVLTSLGILKLPAICRKALSIDLNTNQWVGLQTILIILFTLKALMTIFPSRYYLYNENYRYGNPKLIRKINASVRLPAVVLLSNAKDQKSVIPFTSWDHKSPIIFGNDKGPKNYKIINFYKNRNIYIYKNNKLQRLN